MYELLWYQHCGNNDNIMCCCLVINNYNNNPERSREGWLLFWLVIVFMDWLYCIIISLIHQVFLPSRGCYTRNIILFGIHIFGAIGISFILHAAISIARGKLFAGATITIVNYDNYVFTSWGADIYQLCRRNKNSEEDFDLFNNVCNKFIDDSINSLGKLWSGNEGSGNSNTAQESQKVIIVIARTIAWSVVKDEALHSILWYNLI